MNRERERRYLNRDRDRERHRYDEGTTYHTDRPGGESYRPGGAARNRSRTPLRSSLRRRSRSPHIHNDRYRDGRDEYRTRDRSRERQRSLQRRAYSPCREENNYRPARSPIHEARYARSPRRGRERTPLSAKRSRDSSPVDRRPARSPASKKRRLSSPRPRYRSPSAGHLYSPVRERHRRESDERPQGLTYRHGDADRHTRRSLSPRKGSAQDSGETSRRSSPPVHPSRLRQVVDTREPRATSPPRQRESEKVPPAPNGNLPTGPRNGTRALPTGPAAVRALSSSGVPPPTGPSNRPGPIASFNAPARPRGNAGPLRGNYGGHQRDYLLSRRSSEHHPGPRSSYATAPPTGPRGSSANPPSGPAAFRPTAHLVDASPTKLSRAQRHLTDLPAMLSGGSERVGKTLHNMDKARKLQHEAEKLRKQIGDAEADKRARLREWERLQCEAEGAKLGTDLAAERLRLLEMDELKHIS